MPRYNFDKTTPPMFSNGWRYYLSHGLNASKLADGDIYQFGVAGGFSMQVLGNLLQNIIKPTLNPNFFGFDVFTGMPVEGNEPDKQLDIPGSFKLLEMYNTTDLNEALRSLMQDIASNVKSSSSITIVPGLVEHTLNENFLLTHKPKPAYYVDMDMDIYSPTKYVLDFLVKNKIIIEGTLIGFDDWGQNYPEHPTFSCGESRAFKEVCDEYGISWSTLHTTDNSQQIFISIDKISLDKIAA